MVEYNYNYGDNQPSGPTEQEQAAYVQALQHQHALMLDEMVATHMLWAPELFYPSIHAAGMIHTIIRLRDGRECHVTTSSVTSETTATEWKVQAA